MKTDTSKWIYPGMAALLTWGIATSMAGASIDKGAAAPSVEDIVERAHCRSYYQGVDGRSQAQMTITDKQGNKRSRRFTILRSNIGPEEACERQKYYVYMRSPADVKGMSLLVWKNVDIDDDRWLYLPKLDYVGRIAAGDKRTSFVGSDFLYEDISGRALDADTHELLGTTDKHYVLKSTPKDAAGVDFTYYKMWIDREQYIPMRVEYYDKRDYNYRSYEALKVEDIDDYPTVTASRMSDKRTSRETVIQFFKVAYTLDIPESIFTERYLRKPPKQFFK